MLKDLIMKSNIYPIYILYLMDKIILLASFIYPEKIDEFLEYLNSNFKITKDNIFIYRNLDDDSKLIVTFKYILINSEKINLRRIFPNTIVIHKKGNAIYSINALNKLIDFKYIELLGNIDHKSIIINWDEYQNKLILTNNDELSIFEIKRIF